MLYPLSVQSDDGSVRIGTRPFVLKFEVQLQIIRSADFFRYVRFPADYGSLAVHMTEAYAVPPRCQLCQWTDK